MRNDPVLELAALQNIFLDDDGEELFTSLIADDFSGKEYRDIFATCMDLSAKGFGFSFPTVCLKMNGVPWWDRVGGSGWFAGELAKRIPYRPRGSIAGALRELTILRMQERLKLGTGDVQENIAELEKARDSYLGLLPSSARSVTEYKSVLSKKDSVGISTGFNGIDALTGGMLPGQFVVVGARTGVGKSVFLMNVGAHVAMQGKSVLWIALEMSEREVLKRFCKLLDEKAHPDALDYLSTMKIISGSKTVAQVEGEAMRNKYDMIVLDYLQLCRCEKRYDNDVQELQEITRRMKLLAMKQDTILLAAAQLNRDSEQQTRSPRLSDLRGSGSIEQDADTVILIHRALREPDKKPSKVKRFDKNAAAIGMDGDFAPLEFVVKKLEGKGDTIIYVEKNRNGNPGQLDMRFNSHRLRFEDNSPKPVWMK